MSRICDGGRGHSRYAGGNARNRKKEKHLRKDFQEQKAKEQAFLQLGVWTADVPYLDGYADLVQAYYNRKGGDNNGDIIDGNEACIPSTSVTSSGLVQWILDWASLTHVQLGEDPIHNLTPQQRKLELKTWAGSRLQKSARAVLSREDQHSVDAALKDRNPRAALIKIIMEAPTPMENHDDGDATPERTLQFEWPGYRGYICTFSVLDASAMEALD